MKNAAIVAILTFLITLTAEHADAASGCAIPVGTYQYLFSDGYETYYFNDVNTVRLTAKNRMLESGDFIVKTAGNSYQRVGDQFTFTNINGRYSSKAGGPIFYSPAPTLAPTAAAMPAGSSYNDVFGTYVKQQDGNITFTPKRQLPPLVIDADNCMSGKTASSKMKPPASDGTSGQTTISSPASDSATTVTTSPSGVVVGNGGATITTSPSGVVINNGGTTSIVTSPYGTTIQR